MADTLVALGRHLAAEGQEEEAIQYLEEAFRLGRDLGAPAPTVLAAAHRMVLPGGRVDKVLNVFADRETHLVRGARMVVHFLLWQASKNPIHLAEAHRLLEHLRENAPVDARDALIENVTVHKAIMRDWEANKRECGQLNQIEPGGTGAES